MAASVSREIRDLPPVEVQRIVPRIGVWQRIHVHMDVKSCMAVVDITRIAHRKDVYEN